jgi:ATP-binding cassette, subfamily B, bacterial
VPAGATVALVGESGAGKSTVVSLVLRLYEARRGSVTVDGVDVRRYARDSLRGQIGLVLQGSILFGTSVRENIAYGKLDATDEEIVAAAKAAHAHEFIEELPEAYDTILGERGSTLSGGQRQRLAIARALVRSAPILILDEPMSGLDVESEAKVRDAMRHLTAGRTCLLVTHDLAAAAEADAIVWLEEGRVAATGTHAELVEASLRYRGLAELKRGPAAAGS